MLLLASGCALPEEGFEPGTPAQQTRALGEIVIEDPRVGGIQLSTRGDEASLPILPLRGDQQLRLEFDLVGQEIGTPLEITFAYTDLRGQQTLLPAEYMTGFEQDNIISFERSGASSTVPYVHYTYDFPNRTIGFQVSGNYRAIVRDPQTRAVLLEMPFFVSEQLAEVELAFGATVQNGSVGFATQPAARLRPDASLNEFDGSQYTVCFARNGRTDGFRCAPEPSLIDLALFQFFLPREAAFPEQPPLFDLDMGFLSVNEDILDLDRSTAPPTATLDLDYAEFGGDVRQAVVSAIPLIESVYRDIGRADVDAQYVDVVFRLVPPNSRQFARRIFVTGSFNGWRRTPGAEMEWKDELGRYEVTLRLKQGRYIYAYDGIPTQAAGLGAPSLFTAYVYLNDPQRFTDRLVAVRSGVAR